HYRRRSARESTAGERGRGIQGPFDRRRRSRRLGIHHRRGHRTRSPQTRGGGRESDGGGSVNRRHSHHGHRQEKHFQHHLRRDRHRGGGGFGHSARRDDGGRQGRPDEGQADLRRDERTAAQNATVAQRRSRQARAGGAARVVPRAGDHQAGQRDRRADEKRIRGDARRGGGDEQA